MGIHQKLLAQLYELYKENSDNSSALEEIASISWGLEHELGFDKYGYFELAELIKYGESDDNAKQHYIEVIESKLKV